MYIECDLVKVNSELQSYNEQTSASGFWDNPTTASIVVKKQQSLEKLLTTMENIETKIEEYERAFTQTPDENGCYVNMVNGYIVANKKYCLPPSYDPGTNQEAYDQLLKMISDANSQGIYITILSGYRSYEDQVETYDYWVSIYGEEYASTISAKPGYSEHQTGLAFDLGDANNPYCDLEECFESTEAGIWLAQHAHEYGFIIRYPKGSEAITGYAYEPWHFRYVGDIATDIYEQQTTLEEYLQVP
jgi:D-alanyl-D-alanine carboxypeptidase